jgi:hypothetical protein
MSRPGVSFETMAYVCLWVAVLCTFVLAVTTMGDVDRLSARVAELEQRMDKVDQEHAVGIRNFRRACENLLSELREYVGEPDGTYEWGPGVDQVAPPQPGGG